MYNFFSVAIAIVQNVTFHILKEGIIVYTQILCVYIFIGESKVLIITKVLLCYYQYLEFREGGAEAVRGAVREGRGGAEAPAREGAPGPAQPGETSM